jgi:hypothetical protein
MIVPTQVDPAHASQKTGPKGEDAEMVSRGSSAAMYGPRPSAVSPVCLSTQDFIASSTEKLSLEKPADSGTIHPQGQAPQSDTVVSL